LGLVALVVPAGCLFSPDEDPGDGPGPDPDEGYPFPDTADQMVENFTEIYGGMDIDAYREILHADYRFILGTADGDDEYYNLDTELALTENMFSGEQGPTDDARPISEIQMVTFPQGIWDEVPENEPNFGGHGAVKRVYTVDILVTRPQYNTFVIQGQVDFYAVRQDSLVDGQNRDYWRLLGQWDHTSTGGGLASGAAQSVAELAQSAN
jgi:hypothetical protein